MGLFDFLKGNNKETEKEFKIIFQNIKNIIKNRINIVK